MSDSDWIWSAAHNDHYRWVTDQSGSRVCQFSKQVHTDSRRDSQGQGSPTQYGTAPYGNYTNTAATPYGVQGSTSAYQVSYAPGRSQYATPGQYATSGQYTTPGQYTSGGQHAGSGSYGSAVQYAHGLQYSSGVQHGSSSQHESGGTQTPTPANPNPSVQMSHGPSGQRPQYQQYQTGGALPQVDVRAAEEFTEYAEGNYISMAPAPATIRASSPVNREIEDELDPAYREQEHPHRFFKRGRVFAVLHVELLGTTVQNRSSPAIFVTRFGQKVYATIRRFIVIRRSREHCEAVPINTYSARATTKPGVDPETHGQVYIGPDVPPLLTGERSLGCDPIRIIPTEQNTRLFPESRINYDLVHSVQFNVRVKNIGKVCEDDIRKLVAGFQRVRADDRDDQEE